MKAALTEEQIADALRSASYNLAGALEKLKAAAAAMKAAPVSKLPADDSMWDDF